MYLNLNNGKKKFPSAAADFFGGGGVGSQKITYNLCVLLNVKSHKFSVAAQ